jgi:hypothetical protein
LAKKKKKKHIDVNRSQRASATATTCARQGELRDGKGGGGTSQVAHVTAALEDIREDLIYAQRNDFSAFRPCSKGRGEQVLQI